MKPLPFLALALAAALAFFLPKPARAADTVSFDFFYDSLAPYGEWIDVGDYGTCWRPADVDPDWTPYSDGYWAYTDAGWTWVSYEEFGGIVYHYGRWIKLEDEGWCWRPDYEWAPAWVSWRQSDDYVGWAPLPPEAHWRPEVGISIWVDRTCDIGPGYYNFCRINDFGAPVLRPVIINRVENVTIIRRTTNITNITYNTSYGGGRVIYNGGLDYAFVNQRSARPLPALKLVERTNFDPGAWRSRPGGDRRGFLNAQAQGNQLIVVAPRVAPPADPGFLRSQVKRSFATAKVSKGWNMVKSPEVREQLQQEMGRQSRGLTPESAPAKPVQAQQLTVLPAKADPNAPSPVTAGHDRRDRNPDRRGETANAPATTPNNNNPTAQTAPANAPAGATSTPPANARDDRRNGRDGRDRGQDRPATASGNPATTPAGRPLQPFNPAAQQDPRSSQSPNSQASTPSATSSNGQDSNRGNGRGDRRRGDQQQPQQQQQPATTTQNPPADTPDANSGRNGNPRGQAADQDRMARERAAQAGQQPTQDAQPQQRPQADQQDRQNRQRQADAAAAADRQRQMQAQQQQAQDAQRQQAEQDRANRQRQAESAAADRQRQMQAQQDQQRAQDAQRQQAEQDRANRQRQADSAAADRQRQMQQAQQAQQEQQRAGEEARARAGDRARQMEAQRQQQQQQQQQDQQRRQSESQRPPMENRRPENPQPGGSPNPGNNARHERGKDGKDKDKDNGNQ